MSIQKSSAQNEILKEAPGSRQPPRSAPVPFSRFKHLLRGKSGIPFHVSFMFTKIVDRIVEKIAGKPPARTGELQSLMQAACELRNAFAVQPLLEVGIPAGVFNPCAQVPGSSCYFIYVELRAPLFPVHD